jgi:hypothetical protein
MNTGGAIVISAVMVAAIYAWRWFTGGEQPAAKLNASSLAGQGPLVSPEGFLVAWGTIYLMLSILAGFSEALAASLAISILLGDILVNAVAISKSTTALREQKTSNPAKGKVKQ